MEHVLNQSIVVKQTADAVATEYSRSFELPPGNAVELVVVVQNIAGTSTSLTVALESSNDDQNWAEEYQVAGIVAVGSYAARVPQDPANVMASRRLRLRYDLAAVAASGVAVVCARANTVSL